MTQNKINLIPTFSEDGYDSYSILQNGYAIENLDQETAAELITAATDGVLSGDPVVISGGHCYERKGYLTLDPLAGHRNASYGRTGDDVILQITVRVPFESVKATVEKLQAAKLQAEIAATEAEIAATEAARAELDGRIAALREKQTGLTAKS